MLNVPQVIFELRDAQKSFQRASEANAALQ
jgi:hypothetical protein